MVGVATAFAVIIGKEIFGGTGMNILNIALTARAFLFFAYPTSMSGDKVWMAGDEVDGFTGSTALGDLATFMSDKPTIAGEQVLGNGLEAYANSYSFLDSVLGIIPGSIGETSLIAILIGLIAGQILGAIPGLTASMAVALLVPYTFYLDPWIFELPAIHQLMIGGFDVWYAFLWLQIQLLQLKLNAGKFVYGFLGGFLRDFN